MAAGGDHTRRLPTTLGVGVAASTNSQYNHGAQDTGLHTQAPASMRLLRRLSSQSSPVKRTTTMTMVVGGRCQLGDRGWGCCPIAQAMNPSEAIGGPFVDSGWAVALWLKR
ncbi:hypothetical protein LTR20_010946 [Exophiala xenobiotica]|nr:hypothetical protein LTR41_009125 [Exophiala xenobiotica]KAK5316506.1 hypothetical protein LTR93_009307 [Exophiala xenobiotica]KAK5358543.1 hypothetical protein LTS13_010868 [Exophiala xenobiotica]KAK5425798.1 hypothetical protein LTR34_010730 [Exophiala xenobiotica]KAK5452639.1 hypothetical protein LTR20_010946 [Exophiala xenobiotica]